MIGIDEFVDEDIDTSFDDPPALNFKTGFAEVRAKHKEINLIHYPWVGVDYKTQSTKILVVMESSYLVRDGKDRSVARNVKSLCAPDYSRRILKEAAILGPGHGGYDAPAYQTLNKILTGHDWEDTARKDLWRTLAFYNFVTWPADKSGVLARSKTISEEEYQARVDEDKAGFSKVKECFPNFKAGEPEVSKKDLAHSNDIEVFQKVFDILQPGACIVASSKIRDTAGGGINKICAGNNCDCVFTPHPGWFIYQKPEVLQGYHSSKLPVYLRDIFSKFKR